MPATLIAPPLDLQRNTSLHLLEVGGISSDPDLARLAQIVERSAQLLPAEGPINSFVFLNPLHAFEYLPFEEAVVQGGRWFGCQPFLSEARYRKEVEENRIQLIDLRSVLEDSLGGSAWDKLDGLTTRLELRLAMLRTTVMFGPDAELQWYIEENRALKTFRSDVSQANRKKIVADIKRWAMRDLVRPSDESGEMGKMKGDPRLDHVLWPLPPMLTALLRGKEDSSQESKIEATWEAYSLRALWQVCSRGMDKLPRRSKPEQSLPVRPRDALLLATGADSDRLVHDVLVKFCAAFVDQGVAHWHMPERELGFFQAFSKLYQHQGTSPDRWRHGLADELRRQQSLGYGPLESIAESLTLLGISEKERERFLPATLLALRGWASMIRQMEVRPDRVPVPCPVGTLTEFLAIRLILERLALRHLAAEHMGYLGPLSGLRQSAMTAVPPQPEHSKIQRVFYLFQLAQALGWAPSKLHELTIGEWTMLIDEIESFSEIERRKIFHLALEHRYRTKALAALASRAAMPRAKIESPKFQAVFCIDTREESMRRHLEESCPDAETFSTAGFFNVPIYYRGAADAHFSALCPIVVRPKHWVTEDIPFSLIDDHKRRAKTRHLLGATVNTFNIGSRSFASGAILSSIIGMLTSIPLVARVIFPRWTSRLMTAARSFLEPPRITRLTLERDSAQPGAEPDQLGFSLEEMANIGERVLRDIGLTSNFARLVLFAGHGSACLNNPHKSAYDCGACSGNAGGPNARALAAMLNDIRVREILAARGLAIPRTTRFLGGLHNTCTDTMTFFDLEQLPKSHEKDFEEMSQVFAQAFARNAHERCRRFESAPLTISLEEAIQHVHIRAEDLAQTRPEFGNASNAMCFVGRRDRLRGLYMDRRCFQQSYDPTQDDERSSILARILAPVVPVCQGINLEYTFSAIDSPGWGSGTKLPHNVTSLLGVMDGAASDLRQGLPWQSVEIHEPLRLLFVIETTVDRMTSIMERDPDVGRILKNGWAHLALLDPDSSDIWVFQNGGFHLQSIEKEHADLPIAKSSMDWYVGRRDNLDFALIDSQRA
jgi:uncharacterized protein YbcC (UPF0753/DUF2309 family)